MLDGRDLLVVTSRLFDVAMTTTYRNDLPSVTIRPEEVLREALVGEVALLLWAGVVVPVDEQRG